MKLFKNIILISFWAAVLASCTGMDATYQEFIEDGPVIYIGRVDSLTAYAGRNRAMLEWDKLIDPRATTAKIFWENRTQSMEVELTNKDKKTQVIVPDLKETSYVFEVFTYDRHGNSSIATEVPCTVYGESYESWLYAVKVKSTKLSGTALSVTFAKALDETFIAYEITYKTTSGANKTVELESPAVTIALEDFAGTSFTYRSVYLPEKTAIDKFYSETLTYTLQ